MSHPSGQPSSEPSSAPESGTVRDDTSGNQPAQPNRRGVLHNGYPEEKPSREKDDPSYAGEER